MAGRQIHKHTHTHILLLITHILCIAREKYAIHRSTGSFSAINPMCHNFRSLFLLSMHSMFIWLACNSFEDFSLIIGIKMSAAIHQQKACTRTLTLCNQIRSNLWIHSDLNAFSVRLFSMPYDVMCSLLFILGCFNKLLTWLFISIRIST